ncbi:MAG TPA: hypothetical protein VFU15_05345, partial [Bacteroidia bacterium]|nr:hypothetical protein [Bacteroidia bacterium]
RNNTVYVLEGMKGDEKFAYEIPSMLVVECESEGQPVTRFAASRRLVGDTKKSVDKKGNIHFFIFLKGKNKMVNPVNGVYISAQDFPFDLPVPEEEEITGDEEE